MKRSSLATTWFGILILSGMFLMGQDTWEPPVTPLRPAPETGISTCYNASAVLDPCPTASEPFYGQDAQYSNHPMSFASGANTVTDNVTKIIWQREDDDAPRTLAAATTYCEDSTLAGQTDWRLPNIYELQAIVDLSAYSPAINTTAFPGVTANRYWSQTANASSAGQIWTVNFTDGDVVSVSSAATNLVMCVRGTETAPSLSDNGDGTVTDTGSGLVWQQADDDDTKTWQEALDYCEDLELPIGGSTNWRLPNAKELRNILDMTTSAPAIDVDLFPTTNSAPYWSSSTQANSVGRAWCANFNNGDEGYATKTSTTTGYVRCVRNQ